jgi:hypothetical protein
LDAQLNLEEPAVEGNTSLTSPCFFNYRLRVFKYKNPHIFSLFIKTQRTTLWVSSIEADTKSVGKPCEGVGVSTLAGWIR